MFRIEQLAKHHDKKAFDCGNEPLNRYLQQYANQHAKKGLSKTYALTDSENPHEILGFYSISAGSLREAGITSYPNDLDLPCVLIGRLAVASHAKGQGIANYLMASAFELVKRLSHEVGIAVILVDLKGSHLIGFYERFGFRQTAPDSLTMYIRTSDLV